MHKFLFIVLSVIGAYICEHVVTAILGSRAQFNMLLLLVVFFNLFRGIRYSLAVAVLAGLLKDSYSVHSFGINIFIFVACAYLTTFLKWYFYRAGSESFRLAMVFLVCSANVVMRTFLNMMFFPVNWGEVFLYVYLPQVFLTTLVTNTVFNTLKKCALRYSV